MTRDDIIRIAQEVTGVNYPVSMSGVQIGMSHNHLERFAALVAAAEREACAKVLDDMADEAERDYEPTGYANYYREKAAAIRARGNQ